MKDESKKEIIVTIISSIVVVTITIIMGIINKQKEVKQVFINSPVLDNVNFVDYFGLKKNKVFHYIINETSYSEKDNKKYVKEEIRVKIKVIDEILINKGALFVLDNNIMNPQKSGVKSGVLIVSNLVFFIADDYVESYIKLVKGNKEQDEIINYDNNEMFNLPFFEGQKFGGDLLQYLRKDNLYQYYVQKEGSSNYFDGQKMIELPRYRLYYLTLPDTEYIEFIPYVGIVEINYHHNGTVIEKIIHLENVDNP